MFKYQLVFLGIFFCYNSFSQADTGEKLLFELQKPRGSFYISRFQTNLKDTGTNREIPLFIYYPSNEKPSKNYIVPTEEWRLKSLPILEKKLGTAAAGSVSAAKAFFSIGGSAIRNRRFPLVLFAPGMGWSSLEYSSIIQEIVSNGYIVVAVNTAPLSPVLPSAAGGFIEATDPKDRYAYMASTITFVTNQLKHQKEKIHHSLSSADFQKLAVIGHSLGGAAALLSATSNPDITTAVNMDGDLLDASAVAKPAQPILFLHQLPDVLKGKTFLEMQNDTDRGWRYQQMTKTAAASSKAQFICIEGIYHSNFQDYALLPLGAIPENIRKTRLGPIDGKRGLDLISLVLINYLNEQLKSKVVNWQKIANVYQELSLFIFNLQQNHDNPT